MSLHIAAKKGQIAESILLPGDPLRAEFIAENFLRGAEKYTDIRNMYGFTGTYKGVPVSVQGTGMGMPSMGIYSWELITEYGVQNLIRIGTEDAFTYELDRKRKNGRFLSRSLPPPIPTTSMPLTCRDSTARQPAGRF